MQPDTLTTKQERAIAALLAGEGPDQAAAAAHVNPSTLWNWQKQPLFRERLQEARQETFRDALQTLKSATVAAVATLSELLKSDNPSVKLRAALGILDQAHKGSELLDIQERLSALEAAQAAQETTPKGWK